MLIAGTGRRSVHTRTLGMGGNNPRKILSRLLARDDFTVANYQLNVGLTNAGAGKCSAWANQIGAAPSLTAAGAARPDIQADGSLLFDGTAMTMQAAFTLIQPETVYIVVKQVTWTVNDFIFDGLGTNSMEMVQTPGSPNIAIYAGTAAVPAAGIACTLGSYDLITAIFNGATSSLQVNSTASGAINPGVSNGSGFTLGSIGTQDQVFSNIQVKEIIIRSVTDGAATKGKIQALLRAIHGTP